MAETTTCHHCGATLNSDAKFCPECGTPVSTPQSTSQGGSRRPEGGRPKIPLVLGLLALLLAAVLGLAIYGDKGTDPQQPMEERQPGITGLATEELIRRAVLAKGVSENRQAVQPTDIFTSDIQGIYCVFELGENARGHTLSYAWHADEVDADNASHQLIKQDRITLPADMSADELRGSFSIALPGRAWPAGNYHLDLMIDERKVLTLPFTITSGSRADIREVRVAAAGSQQSPPPARPETARPSSSTNKLKSKSDTNKTSGNKRQLYGLNTKIKPLYQPKQIHVRGDRTTTEIRDIILESMNNIGWTSKERGRDHIEGNFYLFDTRASINVRYSNKFVSIKYLDSKGLDYRKSSSGPIINELYNSWVSDLENSIRQDLQW